MKIFVTISFAVLTGFLNFAVAQVKSPSSAKYFSAFPVALGPVAPAQKIDWTRTAPQNKRALAYKTAFESAVAQFKSDLPKRTAARFAGKFLVITIGCGSECNVIGLYNISSGVPALLEQTTRVGISYEQKSSLLVIDSKEAIEEVYGPEAPPDLKPQYLVVSESAEVREFRP